MKNLLATSALAVAPLLAPGQSVSPITDMALGYPVPRPVESQTPVAGFRDYDALQARHMALALADPSITIHTVGTSWNGREVVAYRFAKGPETTPEGTPRPAAMIQGTIHAREWASPEVATALFEHLALQHDADPITAYLLENLEIVILPIGNPDGFVMTQLYPDETVNGTATGNGGRDGRMRRKNHRGVDEQIDTFGDFDQGVDLNRNHAFGFGRGSSGNQGSILYRGPSPGSEPESQALYAAAALLDGSRLRFYVDIHSYSQLYYAITDDSTTRNEAVLAAYTVMADAAEAVAGRDYALIETDLATGAVGATDEYFTGTYGAMGYTLEIRPASQVEIPNGFLLPDAQIVATREENRDALLAGLYYAAGPPAVLEVALYDPAGNRVWRQQRVYTEDHGGPRRRLSAEGPGASPDGVYTLAITFNKPMRTWRDGAARSLPGREESVSAAVSFGNGTPATNLRFPFDPDAVPQSYARYPGDTLLADIHPGSGGATALTPLVIDVTDAAGMGTDADPRTLADWSRDAGWTGWETGNPTDPLAQAFSTEGDFLAVLPVIGAPPNTNTWLID